MTHHWHSTCVSASDREASVPTYQYACTECGHRFEAFQSFTDDALTECPACTGRLRKVFNSVGVVFKGAGFYRTDSREAAKPKDGAKDGAGKTSEKAGDKAASTPKADSGAGTSSSAGSGTPSGGSPSTSSSGSSTAGSAA
jgi:putative FmdB family regulatory protein